MQAPWTADPLGAAGPGGGVDPPRPSARNGSTISWLVLVVGLLLVAVPTLLVVAQRSWATEQGEYGVLALAIGLYLLGRSLRSHPLAPSPPHPAVLGLLAAGSVALYLGGRVATEYIAETYGLLLALVTVVYMLWGGRALRAAWFPLAFVFLSLPLPISLLVPLSSTLRLLIAQQAEHILAALGVATGRDGLSLFIDNHQIDIRQACSGMNSLISLSLIGMAYIHLWRRPPVVYCLMMTGPIFLAAILANLCRVLVVAGLTHAFGESVGQGLLHETAGLLAFGLALGLIIGLDAVAGRTGWMRRLDR